MVNTEMGTFLRDLFARCEPGCPVTFLTLSAIHPGGDRPTPSRHVPLGDQVALHQTLEQLIEANRAGWGAYIGIATRQRDLGRWSRGGKSDLAVLPALFADLDEPDDALIRLGWFDLPASCILHSGRGYHAYWFLERPTTDFATAEQALHGLAGCLREDEALSVAQSLCMLRGISLRWIHIHRNGKGRILPLSWEKAKHGVAKAKSSSLSGMR